MMSAKFEIRSSNNQATVEEKHLLNYRACNYVQFSSVYLFAIEKYMKRSKKKMNYLDSHGEEAQKKPAGFWRMGSLR